MMATAGDAPVSVTVPHTRGSVATARHAFAAQLRSLGVPEEVHDDAVLVLSELVSNAVKHATPLPGGGLTVAWRISPDIVHMEITDGGASTRPHAGLVAVSALGGRGLDIVRTVSDQWGVTEDHGSVTVWAEVRRDGQPH